MAKPIGIIGCSSEGAALCYRTICLEAALHMGAHAHPEVLLHTHSLAEYEALLHAGDLGGIASLMRSSAEKLIAVGAKILVCPDNTIHQAFVMASEGLNAERLHIAEVVTAEAARRSLRCVGITGTAWLVHSEVYPEKLEAAGVGWMRPEEADARETDRIIMEELVEGKQYPESLARLQKVVQRLSDRGCDAVVLGCTELPLLLNDRNSPLPTLDSTRLLARAALHASLGLA